MTDATPTPAAPAAPAQDATPAPDLATPSGTPPPEPGASSASTPPAPAPKRYKFKANGQDVELDASQVDDIAAKLGVPADEILKGSSMARSSYQRWQEAARLRKEADERVRGYEQKLKEYESRYDSPDVKRIMEQDPTLSREEAWALAQTARLYERSQMSPEARRAMEERQAREKAESELKKMRDEQERGQMDAATRQEIQRIDRELPQVMQEAGLPAHPAWGRHVLEKVALQARQGVQIDFREAAMMVHAEMQEQDRARVSAMNDEQLENWLGPEAVKRILQRSVAKARGTVQSPVVAPPPTLPTPQAKPSRFITDVDEWRKKNW